MIDLLATLAGVPAISDIPANITDVTDWFKYIVSMIIGALTVVLAALWKYTSTETKELRNKLDEKVDASTLTANTGDDQIWEELKAIRAEMQQHERNDASVHMKFGTDIAALASREDLMRALDRQTEMLLARLNKENSK